ncbi:MAG: acyl-CoA dehydrogenase family protein [Polyangiaceae bacterium]
MELGALVAQLLATPLDAAPGVAAWMEAHRQARAGLSPVDAAILGGAAADRLAYAFAAGYAAALHALCPSLPDGALVAFCATEAGGVHPRAIATRLDGAGPAATVTGHKRFVTFAEHADTLLVVASEGAGADGRNRLRVAVVAARGPGVTLSPLPPTPFTPEMGHAEVTLDAAPALEVLPGDGYARYLKPFRTIEDVHVHAALLGHLAAAARRGGWPQPFQERVLAGISAVRALSAADASAPGTHLALAGALATARGLVEESGAFWAGGDPALAARWERDRVLVMVAEKARVARTTAAWSRIDAPQD